MTRLRIHGGIPLTGQIVPSANKNAVLPVLCATLLSREPFTLRNVPNITDVHKVLDFFVGLGSKVEADFSSGVVRIWHDDAISMRGVHLPQGMRSIIMLIPALMYRFGQAVLRGDAKGCTLGMREIDPHVAVFHAFGCRITQDGSATLFAAPSAFEAVEHWLEYASVTTTENFLMCAIVATGTSRLVNAACEPHVQEFCRFLRHAGVAIEGSGTSTLTIIGPARLAGIVFAFGDDFHEVATFLALGAITGGDVQVRNNASEHFPLLDRTFQKLGVHVEHAGGWSRAYAPNGLRVSPPFTAHMVQKIEAAPWPYVPADLLPIFIALAVRAKGEVQFWNKVYEGGLGWAPELAKFGARVVACDPHRIVTLGSDTLVPAEIESPYIIRVAIALMMVAASLPGESVILNAGPIRRAHPNYAENLVALGSKVDWT